ncbi:hypothetical protein PybrP1_000211 [[Pythium] brassicae (nom. inval.)]|nr:hypothetical protein PybrP1_000211 [[Pythium] brassicae (nom. inval.)]
MVSRGSSIHHTRRTSNPFMTTSSGIVGINLAEKVAFDAPRLPSAGSSNNNHLPSNNSLSEFMYQTTSRQLGDGSAHERSKLSQRMDKLTLRREVEEKGLVKVRCVDVVSPHDCALSPGDVLPPPIDTRAISDPRAEHSLYATSTREVGAEKTQLRVEAERLGRPNSFTTSFNGFRYRDFGLNTAITKSKICGQLDMS